MIETQLKMLTTLALLFVIEFYWYMIAIYIAVGLLVSISSLSTSLYDEKEVRISTLLVCAIKSLFFAAIWPIWLFLLLLDALWYECSTSRQLISKWWNKINIVLWRRK